MTLLRMRVLGYYTCECGALLGFDSYPRACAARRCGGSQLDEQYMSLMSRKQTFFLTIYSPLEPGLERKIEHGYLKNWWELGGH